MKQNLITLILFLFISTYKLFAQQSPVLNSENTADKVINEINNNQNINADSAFRLLSNWSDYPVIKKNGEDYLYYFTDSLYGKIPLRIYIPLSYDKTRPNSCVLLLHGAVGGVTFNDVDTVSKFNDLIFSILKQQRYIIIRPVADPSKKFDWVVDRFKGEPNLTFKVIADILKSIKRVVNIDDDKVFAFGHSDGSDGAIGLGVYAPDQFAGVIAYNSMLNNIFANDFYIRNIINTHLYIVHSDLDELRPIQQNRLIINELVKIDTDILYKEYIGYQHYDKHLNKDIPYTTQFINSTSRNPFKTQIYWETDDADIYNSCNWLKITAISNPLTTAKWQTPFYAISYNKRTKQYVDNEQYYNNLNKSAAVKGTYNNNTFTIQTSGVTAIELLISPVMVNLEQPVTVNINGKNAFSGKVIADKKFTLESFRVNADKDALWVTCLKLNVN